MRRYVSSSTFPLFPSNLGSSNFSLTDNTSDDTLWSHRVPKYTVRSDHFEFCDPTHLIEFTSGSGRQLAVLLKLCVATAVFVLNGLLGNSIVIQNTNLVKNMNVDRRHGTGAQQLLAPNHLHPVYASRSGSGKLSNSSDIQKYTSFINCAAEIRSLISHKNLMNTCSDSRHFSTSCFISLGWLLSFHRGSCFMSPKAFSSILPWRFQSSLFKLKVYKNKASAPPGHVQLLIIATKSLTGLFRVPSVYPQTSLSSNLLPCQSQNMHTCQLCRLGAAEMELIWSRKRVDGLYLITRRHDVVGDGAEPTTEVTVTTRFSHSFRPADLAPPAKATHCNQHIFLVLAELCHFGFSHFLSTGEWHRIVFVIEKNQRRHTKHCDVISD